MLYDLNGNRTGKTGRRLSAGSKQEKMAVSYRYDGMNRLTNEDRDGAGERYAYDLCGNRLLKEQYRGSCVDVTEGYRYNERNELTERIRAGSLTAYRYDKNGSIISEEEEGRRSEYRYDLLNRQTYVRTLDGKEQENFYDGEGLRAGLTENGKKTTFLYHNGEILAECDGESAPVKRYFRGRGLSHVQMQDNDYHAYHQDEQGSTAYITGQSRETENIYQYDTFGNLLEKQEDVSNRILYTGQQYDQETGQYYLRARYYNPVVWRFLQEDTYRGDGLNLYAYCANNPVVYFDPSGNAVQYANKDEYVQGDIKSNIGPNTTRRIGISDGEIVVFDETINGIFHGHVRSWNELSEAMKAALRKAGLVNKKGKNYKMKREYVLINDKEYSLILSLNDADFDYYTDVSIKLYINNNCYLLFKDNLLALKNIVEQYNENVYTLNKELDEKKIGVLLNEYYRMLYENKIQSDIILDTQGNWIGEKYCCFMNLKYATWMYRYNGNIILKVTPIFREFEKNFYIIRYKKFIKEYKDLFKRIVSLQQMINAKKKIIELYEMLF